MLRGINLKMTLSVIGHEAGEFVGGVGDVWSGEYGQIHAFTDDGIII